MYFSYYLVKRKINNKIIITTILISDLNNIYI